MGNDNSGRRCERQLVEHFQKISIRDIVKELADEIEYFPCSPINDLMIWVTAHNHLFIRRGLGEEHVKTSVKLEWTPCRYGGSRPWFLCPCCTHRYGILYRQGTDAWCCRKCLGLVYASQRENNYGRIHRRIEKVDRKLGRNKYSKPKYMHQRTHEKLLAKLEKEQRALDDAFYAELPAFLKKVERKQTN